MKPRVSFSEPQKFRELQKSQFQHGDFLLELDTKKDFLST